MQIGSLLDDDLIFCEKTIIMIQSSIVFFLILLISFITSLIFGVVTV